MKYLDDIYIYIYIFFFVVVVFLVTKLWYNSNTNGNQNLKLLSIINITSINLVCSDDKFDLLPCSSN